MDESFRHRYSPRDALAEFKNTLETYTLTGTCGRKFVRVQRLKEWICRGSNTLRLLEAAYASISCIQLPIRVDAICQGHDCALLVFSILLDLGQGALIHFFHRNDRVDRLLPFQRWDLVELYREIADQHDYSQILGGQDPKTLCDMFSARQYAFCPITFQFKHGKDYNSQMIVPVMDIHKTSINDKGGTASVWQISVLEEFVGSSLRLAIETSRFEDPKDHLGWRYRMALKRFEQSNRQFYETEKEAFQALTDQEGMIQYLGEFGHKDKEENKSNYNILLEYGQLDLDEFFFDPETLPPVLSEEINSFWDDILDIVGALKDIHSFKVRRQDVSHEYYGWHADIKPDNILRVNGKFKLADPGFASFKKVEGKKKLKQRAEQREDATLVKGGTVTYGAPECHFHHGQQRPVTRAIDIWSLGCVLSVVATWVALGQQGILQFNRLRERAIDKLISASAIHKNVNQRHSLAPGDYFHNGSEVLPIVTDWHNHLRRCQRASDHITNKVLDLIDQKMLCTDHNRRISASLLHEELEGLLTESRASSKDQLPQSFCDALREMDDTIPLQTSRPDPSQLIPPAPDGGGLSVEARKQRKSMLLGAPLKRTSHRSDALRNSQTTSQPSIPSSSNNVGVRTSVPTIVEPGETYTKRKSIKHPSSVAPSSSRNSQTFQPQSISAPLLSNLARRSTGGTAYSDLTPSESASSKLKKQNPFQARAELDRRKEFFRKTRKKDDFLTQFFGKRDLHFLVDNAESMLDSWDEATWLLSILVEKAIGQDENGMDLSFTNGKLEVKGSNKVKAFKDRMEEAKPKEQSGIHTDIRRKLGDILENYLRELRKINKYHSSSSPRKLTLVIFTDGRWEGMADKHAIGKTIANFAKDMEAIQGNSLRVRQVSFQFIQFGNDEEARYRLERLDDDLPFEETIPDMVDTIDSTGNVNKMLLGSFVEEFDTAD